VLQFVKAGFAADNLPRYMFPSIVGRPVLRAEEEAIGDVDLKPITVGEEAAALRRALEISYPLENGIIRNWEDMGHVWSYLFTERMGIDPKEHRILLTEAPMNPRENRRKMIETMFEKYGFHSLQVSIQAMLTLYAQGLLSGCVLDSGDGVTHIVAVYDGFELSNLTKRLDVAGRHITRYLIKLLLTRGYAFNRSADFQTVQELKERFAYVALDIAKERKLAEETTVLVEKWVRLRCCLRCSAGATVRRLPGYLAAEALPLCATALGLAELGGGCAEVGFLNSCVGWCSG